MDSSSCSSNEYYFSYQVMGSSNYHFYYWVISRILFYVVTNDNYHV